MSRLFPRSVRRSVPNGRSIILQYPSGPDHGSGQSPHRREGLPVQHVGGALLEICLAVATITLPLIALSVLLLALIFRHRVSHAQPTSNTLRYPTLVDEPGVYYVNMSATKLITIASWASSVAPMLPSFVMILWSYPLARRFLARSDRRAARALPTPFQLSLVVEFLHAGLGSFWKWLQYLRWPHHERLSPAVTSSMVGLLFATVFSYLILAADTWLHVSTSTVLFTQIVPASSGLHTYGRKLSSSCTGFQPYAFEHVCNINNAATASFLVGASEAYRTLYNLSTLNQVRTAVVDGSIYTYLADAQTMPSLDYRASTVALNTQCVPISRACHLTAAYGASTPFNCTPAFFGDLQKTQASGGNASETSLTLGISLFRDATLLEPVSFNTTINPFYWAMFASVNLGTAPNSSFYNDPEIVHPVHGGDAFILSCNTTVHDFNFSWLNGSIKSATATAASNVIGGMMMAPVNSYNFGMNSFEAGSRVAAFSNTSQELADKFGSIFSQTLLSLSARVYDPQLNLEEQALNTFLVARITRASLWALIAVNLGYVAFGAILALVALLSNSPNIRDVQSRLSVAGLVAAACEGSHAQKDVEELEDLFSERRGIGHSSRVRMKKADDGGWEYSSLSPPSESSKQASGL